MLMTEDEFAAYQSLSEETEDHRWAFGSVRLAEHTDADFAELAARLLVFSSWRLALFGALAASADPVLAAIAAKGIPELAYHRDYAAQWVIRLGDGTPLSHDRMAAALGVIWPL